MAEEARLKLTEERLIKAFDRGAGQQLQVRLVTFRGREYLDLRNFYLDENDEWKPTRKGIAIPLELYDDLMAALNEVGEILKEG
ncbi:MAG: transcriptional coactivator p15/PC4 family protein [Candidatus Bipolaricaulia bacterium]